MGLQQLLPRGGGAGVIVLAVGAHDANVEERLRVRGVDGERPLVLRERFVGPAQYHNAVPRSVLMLMSVGLSAKAC